MSGWGVRRGLFLQFLVRENHRLARSENPCRTGFLVGGWLVTFLNVAWIVREIEGVDTQFSVFRARQRDADAVAVHHAPDVGGDLAKHIAQIETRDHAISQIEQQFQPFLGLLRRAETDGVAHGERDLAGHHITESNFFRRIGVAAHAGNHQTSQAALCGS